jgi:hypothetical protein
VSWQDWVLSAGSFLVFVSLLPTVVGPDKPALSTSVMSTVLVIVVASTLATLDLWLSAAANYVVAVAWLTIAVQTVLRRQRQSA